MIVDAPSGLMRYFADLKDPRMNRSKRHELSDIITIAICAVICGADGWTEVAMFGECKESWFRTFLDLPNGIPSHDTFRRVFMLLRPDEFENCFIRWINHISETSKGRLIAVDGKTIRRSLDKANNKAATHMKWSNLRSLIRVLCERTVNGETSQEYHYYISSLPADVPEILLGYIRGHWSVENRPHWCLDISFADDARRIRSGYGAENFSRLSRIGLNLLKAEKKLKAGIKGKRLKCGWDHNYLLKVLTGPLEKI